MQLSSRLILMCGLGLVFLSGWAAPGFGLPQEVDYHLKTRAEEQVSGGSLILIARADAAGPEEAPSEGSNPAPSEGLNADEIFRRYEQAAPGVKPAAGRTKGQDSGPEDVGPGGGVKRSQPTAEDEPDQKTETGSDPGRVAPRPSSGALREQSFQSQPKQIEADPTLQPTPPQEGVRTPFNLGINKSVIDGGVDEANMNLQSGVQQGALDNRFPPLEANTARGALRGETKNTTVSGGLTQAQLQRLASHDLVLIIDQSESMLTPDCPISGMGRVGGTVMTMLLGSAASVSRWQWCRDQTLSLAEHTRDVCTKGFSVVLFSQHYAVYPHVTLDQVPVIFRQAFPQGGTNLTDPLLVTINDYIGRRHRSYVKPLAIAIITDGKPSSEDNVRKTIIETTLRMKDPGEIKITFFMIGNSAFNGQAFVSDMERNLTRYGAKYNIVRSVSFWKLMKVGLPRALADALE